MFAYIKGIVQKKEMTGHGAYRLVLDCHGFGMEMHISQQTFLSLPEIDEEAQVYTVFVIKESECFLFAFAEEGEKELFLLLTSVSGIGPKLALSLLGTLKPNELCNAIIQEDNRLISQAPGIGAKVAARIVLELSSKIKTWQENALISKYAHEPKHSIIDDEVREILIGLGYSHGEIVQALAAVRKGHVSDHINLDVEWLVKESLKLLGAGTIAHKL